MNRSIKIVALLLLIVCTVSCKKEDKLTPTTINDGYVLALGTHDYDTVILSYFNKYNSYFLYQFSDKDAYWTPTGYKNGIKGDDGFWKNGFEMSPADPLYIKAQLDLFSALCLQLYSDKFLKDFLPAKILLCSKVDSIFQGYDFSTSPITYYKGIKSVSAWYNYDNICVNYGNAQVSGMTAADSLVYMAKVNGVFIESIVGRKKTNPTADFTAQVNYTTASTNQEDAYARGIITEYFNGPSATSDWYLYITAMATYSEATLQGPPPYTGDVSLVGILNSEKDTNGLIKKRYDIVRKYFTDTYNVDLQAIGNASNP